MPADVVGTRHGGLAGGSVLRVAQHRSAPRAGVRRADPDRPRGPTVRRRPRSSCPTRRPVTAATGSTRCCSMRRCRAWPRRCRAESLADSSEATYLPVSFEKIRVFGEVGRRARCRAELVNPDGDGAGITGPVVLIRRRGHSDRRDQRYLPAARATPHGANAVDAEDLRHRMGRDSAVRPGSRLTRPTEAGWC